MTLGEDLRSSPRQRAAEIIARKLPYARGHHRDKLLGGRRIEEWFSGEYPDLEGLLNALAESPYVNAAAPESSRLISDLISARGPMFRVFTEEEIGIVVEWIRTLRSTGGPVPRGNVEPQARDDGRGDDTGPWPGTGVGEPESASASPAQDARSVRLDKRLLYYQLVNVERCPESVRPAKHYVARCLARARRAMWLSRLYPELRPFEYSRAAFEHRIEVSYREAVDAYRPFVPPPRLSREEYLWLFVQLAPLILVDGCWLRNVGCLYACHPGIAAGLVKIYADEVGGGDHDASHAAIFRELLRSEGIDLPEVSSDEFIRYGKFTSSIFELPLYLLSISQYPRTFLPELLGLNLAIELSGLGAFYMGLVDELSYWRIDPRIITVHIASDNLASGHAALAKAAIGTYLDELGASYGEREVQRHWRRVWRGYVSLRVVAAKTWFDLLIRFVSRFGLKRVQRRWVT
ncbi:MAG: iron-containing redox enzyme family protein [Pseudomonadota bacterium]|nr:iron-containing redox enzyme family protein [Pseudomonadota bacterium]